MTNEELIVLDIAVAEKVMGWNVFTFEQGLHDGNTPRPHCLLARAPTGRDALKVFDTRGNIRWWLPSEDIAAAWLVMEWLHERDCDVSLEGAGDFWSVRFLAGEVTTLEPTAPLAICRAALKACEGAPTLFHSTPGARAVPDGETPAE